MRSLLVYIGNGILVLVLLVCWCWCSLTACYWMCHSAWGHQINRYLCHVSLESLWQKLSASDGLLWKYGTKKYTQCSFVWVCQLEGKTSRTCYGTARREFEHSYCDFSDHNFLAFTRSHSHSFLSISTLHFPLASLSSRSCSLSLSHASIYSLSVLYLSISFTLCIMNASHCVFHRHKSFVIYVYVLYLYARSIYVCVMCVCGVHII